MQKEEVDLSEYKQNLIELIKTMSNEDLPKTYRALFRKRLVINEFTDLIELYKAKELIPADVDIIIEGPVRDMFLNKKAFNQLKAV